MTERIPHDRPALLLVDDDLEICEQMKWALNSDYEVLEARSRTEALAHIRESMPALILLDLGLPPDPDGASEGLMALREIRQIDPGAKIIVITGNSDRAKAIAAVESGAYDFIEKPVQLNVLRIVLQRAAYLSTLERENRALVQRAAQDSFEGLIGTSPIMQVLANQIRRVAPSDVSVLITGESGTGKELVARAIHHQSSRQNKAFVAINCGAIPETLLESELFGYEKGAFTGASQQRKGRIEAAQGGTLFLDEIGDIPLSLQVKLLRFLQEQEMHRLGGQEAIKIDARIVAATNVDLQKAITAGHFREDLYYRLCIVVIAVPSLKERVLDIPLLARAFLLRATEEQRKPIVGFSQSAMDALTTNPWPGNVRELENRIKRAVVMADGKYITPAHLGLQDHSLHGAPGILRASREVHEKDLIRLAMQNAKGNVSKAAADLGISRPTLYQLLARYGLKRSKEQD